MRKQLSTFGADLFVRDCIVGLTNLRAGSVDLVVADPPYNFGMAYDSYCDSKPADEFLSWMQQWLLAAHQSLAKHGSLWVFVPDEWVSEVDLFCRKALKMTRRNWIIWTYSFGQAAQKRFTRSHTHILYFTKAKTHFTFNADAMRVPSARQLVYGDKRALKGGKMPDDTWCLLKADLVKRLPDDGDVWEQSRICGTFKERKKHLPNQIPLPIMERIVRACSKPGDLVVDPFLGSGTTAVACRNLGRRCIGFDISELCINEAKKRLEHKSGDADQMDLFPEKQSDKTKKAPHRR